MEQKLAHLLGLQRLLDHPETRSLESDEPLVDLDNLGLTNINVRSLSSPRPLEMVKLQMTPGFTWIQQPKFHLPSDPTILLVLIMVDAGATPFKGFVQGGMADHDFSVKISVFFEFRNQGEHLYTNEFNSAKLHDFFTGLHSLCARK